MPDPRTSPPTRRLFVGIAPPPEIAARLVRRARQALAQDGELARGVRAYGPDDLHLTLCFLGAFPEARRPVLQATLAEELRGLNAPELVVTGTGAFPSARRPRALWAGIEEDDMSGLRLGTLRNRVWQAALGQQWRPAPRELERPFRPHLTLARVAAGGPPPDLSPFLAQDFRLRWLPVEVTLFESRPGELEERYRPLVSVPLVVRPG